MWNSSTQHVFGRCKIKVRNCKTKEKWHIDYVIVEHRNFTPLLSQIAAEAMGLVTVNYHNFEVCTVGQHTLLAQEYDDTTDTNPLATEYKTVFDGRLGSLPGGQVHLTLISDAEPVVRPPRTLPEARKPTVKMEIDRLEREGIIAKVDRPTDWVNQMAVVDKKSGDVRICIDPRPLNLMLKREHYKLPVLDDILPKLAGSQKFSVCDLQQGYLHCELDEESSFLTTFATPFGRYRWRRLPYGLKVSSEIFQKRLCAALEGLDGIQCVADDIIIFGKNQT